MGSNGAVGRVLLVGVALAFLWCPAAAAADPRTVRVSVASDGTQGNGTGFFGPPGPSASADGRYVAFDSSASNLVVGDTNGSADVFVHDRLSGQTSRVSVASDGGQANSLSDGPRISADGRFVAFESYASNLVPGDTNARSDAFVHDRVTGRTTRVSVASDGTQANDGVPGGVSISADGRYVAFESGSSTLVPGDRNSAPDIFVHDRATGTTSRVSVNSRGMEANDFSLRPAISADGRFVAFASWATNLVRPDTNRYYDVFVHDRLIHQTTRVSVASDGSQGDGVDFYSEPDVSISGDGRLVAFDSPSPTLVAQDTNDAFDVFVHDQLTHATTRASVSSRDRQGNMGSFGAWITASGRFVAFESEASNLVPGDTNGVADVFVRRLAR